jgi:hypothetical protein
MEMNGKELATKADSYYYLIKCLSAEAKYWKEQMDQVNKVIRSINNLEKNLKERVKYAMKESEITEIEGQSMTFKLANAAPKLVIDDVSKLPADYKISTHYVEPNKNKIKDDLKAGLKVDGCRLEENHSLRTTLNKGI